jgi:hypothetical protein
MRCQPNIDSDERKTAGFQGQMAPFEGSSGAERINVHTASAVCQAYQPGIAAIHGWNRVGLNQIKSITQSIEHSQISHT